MTRDYIRSPYLRFLGGPYRSLVFELLEEDPEDLQAATIECIETALKEVREMAATWGVSLPSALRNRAVQCHRDNICFYKLVAEHAATKFPADKREYLEIAGELPEPPEPVRCAFEGRAADKHTLAQWRLRHGAWAVDGRTAFPKLREVSKEKIVASILRLYRSAPRSLDQNYLSAIRVALSESSKGVPITLFANRKDRLLCPLLPYHLPVLLDSAGVSLFRDLGTGSLTAEKAHLLISLCPSQEWSATVLEGIKDTEVFRYLELSAASDSSLTIGQSYLRLSKRLRNTIINQIDDTSKYLLWKELLSVPQTSLVAGSASGLFKKSLLERVGEEIQKQRLEPELQTRMIHSLGSDFWQLPLKLCLSHATDTLIEKCKDRRSRHWHILHFIQQLPVIIKRGYWTKEELELALESRSHRLQYRFSELNARYLASQLTADGIPIAVEYLRYAVRGKKKPKSKVVIRYEDELKPILRQLPAPFRREAGQWIPDCAPVQRKAISTKSSGLSQNQFKSKQSGSAPDAAEVPTNTANGLVDELMGLIEFAPRQQALKYVATSWKKRMEGEEHGYCLDEEYKTHLLPKRAGGNRTIAVPSRTLKRLQRAILSGILEKAPVEECVHGFRKGCSTVTNARNHVGQKLVVNIDIDDFFQSVTYPVILKALRRSLGKVVSDDVLRVVAELSCFEGALPTGAPTSPAIGNIVLSSLDKSLSTHCEKFGVSYTRYADDLTFSGGEDAKRMIPFVRKCLKDVGLKVDEEKLNLFRRGRRQMVTGLVVNVEPNLPRRTRRLLRAAVHTLANGGNLTWHGRPMDQRKLRGLLSYYNGVSPEQAKVLMDKLSGRDGE